MSSTLIVDEAQDEDDAKIINEEDSKEDNDALENFSKATGKIALKIVIRYYFTFQEGLRMN